MRRLVTSCRFGRAVALCVGLFSFAASAVLSQTSGVPADDPLLLKQHKRHKTEIAIELGIGALGKSGNDNAQAGVGFGAFAEFIKWHPITVRFGFTTSWTHTTEGVLPSVPIVTMMPNLDLCVRFSRSDLQPYAGFGLAWVSNHQPTDDRADMYLTGVYDPLGQYGDIYYDLGSGFSPTVRGGVLAVVARRVKLFVDLAYVPIRPELELTYIEIPGGREFTRGVSYDFETFYLMIGVSFGLSSQE